MGIYFKINSLYKKIKKIIYLTIFFSFLLSPNVLASIETFQLANFDFDYKEILILSSKSDNIHWEGKILERLLSLYASDSSIRIHTETLSAINKDKNYMDKEAEFLLMKYQNTSLDLILCLDDESAEFVTKYYNEESLTNTAIVFCGLNDITKVYRYPFNYFTGVVESHNPRVLIDSILEIEPKTTTINIILDESIASRQIENLIQGFEPYYNSKLKFNYIKSNHIEDISNSLKDINSNYPSILVGDFKNSYNTNLSAKDTINIIKESSLGNLYTLNYSYIGQGVLGGYLLSPENHAKLTYEVTNRIFSGDPISSITPIFDLNSTFIFDLDQLIHHEINRKTLPAGTVFINDSWFNQKVSAKVVLCLTIILVIAIISMLYLAFQKSSNDKKAKIVAAQYDEAIINDKVKTEFIANFSHEIRTLLNLILSTLQLLDLYRENGKIKFEDERDGLKLSNIRKNGLRLLKLINNLIDITKLDSGFYHTEFKTKNIVEVIEDIALSVVEYAEAKNIQVIFDTNEEEFLMPMDTEKLDRIILNLLSNAIKFTPSGGSVFVTLNILKDKVAISIKDTGIGISKYDQKFIFNRFIQASNTSSSNTAGSGIGLSLVKSLTELLDGTIELNSALNKGTEFIVTLPVKDYDKTSTDVLFNNNTNLSSNEDKIKVEFSDINL